MIDTTTQSSLFKRRIIVHGNQQEIENTDTAVIFVIPNSRGSQYLP
jgi:hypothetical protein